MPQRRAPNSQSASPVAAPQISSEDAAAIIESADDTIVDRLSAEIRRQRGRPIVGPPPHSLSHAELARRMTGERLTFHGWADDYIRHRNIRWATPDTPGSHHPTEYPIDNPGRTEDADRRSNTNEPAMPRRPRPHRPITARDFSEAIPTTMVEPNFTFDIDTPDGHYLQQQQNGPGASITIIGKPIANPVILATASAVLLNRRLAVMSCSFMPPPDGVSEALWYAKWRLRVLLYPEGLLMRAPPPVEAAPVAPPVLTPTEPPETDAPANGSDGG